MALPKLSNYILDKAQVILLEAFTIIKESPTLERVWYRWTH